ncbi:MAG: hypothetical protein H0T79_03580, partial [Deltaproteobacteria bacterium]|nr:hypothetical protein [Deltaproteobacteria bacterium]
MASPAGADTAKVCLENPLAKGCASDAATPNKPRREPTASATAELFHTTPTKASRAALSQFLVAPAKKAEKARDWARAIPLYQALVVARGP